MKTQPEPTPPGEHVPPQLAAFLSERRDLITSRWIEAVRRNDTLEAAKTINDKELANHLPKLFDDLTAILGGESVAAEAKRDAEAHGEHRWQQHYGLEEVLEELGIVSRILLAHGLDAFADEHPETPKEQLRGARERILRFFEDAAAGSVREYVERNSRQMRAKDLTLSEQRRLALDSAQMGWWQLDLASKEVVCDERFKAIFDTDQEVVSYDWVLSIIHPDDQAGIDAAVQAAVRPLDPAPYAVECRLVRGDGTLRWTTAKGQALFEGKGPERRAVSLVGSVTDVTEANALQDALRESEQQYRLAVEGGQLGTFSWELATRRVRWNAKMKEFFFLPADAEMSFELGVSRLHPDDREPTRQAVAKAMAGAGAYQIEYRSVSPEDGRVRWMHATGQMFKDTTAETFTHVHGVALDITSQKEAQARFQELADAMPQIVWSAQPDGFISYYNARWYEYTGTNREAFGDASWNHILHPDDLAPVIKQWIDCTVSGQPYEQEFRARRGVDGAYRWFLGRAVPIRDASGQILRWLGTNTDIHDNRLLREQNAQLLDSERAARMEAERTSQMKDEFLATLSHELRTPLNAILGWTQVLRGDPANSEDMEAGLATIERNSRAQTQIIEDLLDMSKIISGKVRLDVQPLQLDQVVAAAVDTMRPAATVKAIRLQVLIDPQARMISGDPNRLQQVFWNLLSNALKFTPKGGKVQVVLERVNSHLEVSIADSGEGIAADFLPYVFDRFRQQDASTTRRHGGLGLGLAIVKQLVELHGGSVRVESAGPGQGTTFKVLLPLSVVQPAPDPADPDRRHPQGGSVPLAIPSERLNLAGVKVLVVDDEADARALVQRLLEDRGVLVQTAGSAPEALERMLSQRPDVLVSDIGMPEEDGFALIRQVRALSPEQGGATPAIALTAYARSEDRLKVILAGFQTHMAKPVEAAELLALVASLAGRVAGH